MDALAKSVEGLLIDDEATVTKVQSFCERREISTKGALALTIQKNRTGEFSSLILHFGESKIEQVFPADDLQTYDEGRVGEFLFCYHADLDESKLAKPDAARTQCPLTRATLPACAPSAATSPT